MGPGPPERPADVEDREERPALRIVRPAPSTDADGPTVVSTKEEAERLFGSAFARRVFRDPPPPPRVIRVRRLDGSST